MCGRMDSDVLGAETRTTVHVVDWRIERMPQLIAGLTRALAELGGAPLPPSSLIGVFALAEPDVPVEVRATAVPEGG